MENLANENEAFVEFLKRKNIDPAALETGEPEIYLKWRSLYAIVHEKSFEMQQKFLINPIRRKYPKTNQV